MERLWFKIRKQPRPVLLHEVPEFVAHQRGVNIRPFDKAADARQLLWRKIVVSTHGGRMIAGCGSAFLNELGRALRPAPYSLRPVATMPHQNYAPSVSLPVLGVVSSTSKPYSA